MVQSIHETRPIQWKYLSLVPFKRKSSKATMKIADLQIIVIIPVLTLASIAKYIPNTAKFYIMKKVKQNKKKPIAFILLNLPSTMKFYGTQNV